MSFKKKTSCTRLAAGKNFIPSRKLEIFLSYLVMEIYNFSARRTNVTAIGTVTGVLKTLFVESGNELQMLAQLAAATIFAENRETCEMYAAGGC